MKKILKGSVIITEGAKYWVIEHKKKFIKVLNEDNKEMHVSESVAEADGTVIKGGGDAMDIIKEIWY